MHRSLHINEKTVHFADVLDVDLGGLALLGNKVGRGDQVDTVTQGALLGNLSQQLRCTLRQLHVFFLATDLQDLCQFFCAVWLGRDDQGTIQQIDWQTVWAHVVGAADSSDTTVSCHDHDWCLVALKGSVKEGEALNVQHVDLIEEQDTWDDLGTSLFTPLGNLLIDLLTNLWLDLTDVTSKESHEALLSGVDDINFVEGNSVDDLLTLLQFTLWALNESGLGANVIVLRALGKRAAELGDFTASLVNGNDISSHNLFLANGLNHLASQVVDGLHLGGLKGDLASLGSALDRLVNLNLDNLSLNDLGFFSDADT